MAAKQTEREREKVGQSHENCIPTGGCQEQGIKWNVRGALLKRLRKLSPCTPPCQGLIAENPPESESPIHFHADYASGFGPALFGWAYSSRTRGTH